MYKKIVLSFLLISGYVAAMEVKLNKNGNVSIKTVTHNNNISELERNKENILKDDNVLKKTCSFSYKTNNFSSEKKYAAGKNLIPSNFDLMNLNESQDRHEADKKSSHSPGISFCASEDTEKFNDPSRPLSALGFPFYMRC